jgi:hypothetical protein
MIEPTGEVKYCRQSSGAIITGNELLRKILIEQLK